MNATAQPANIGQAATASRRGRKPSGITKSNVCVRMTAEDETYLADLGGGSKSTGLDKLIALHRQAALAAPV